MLNTTDNVLNMLNSPSRQVGARALLWHGSSSLTTISSTDDLKGFVVDRVGEDGKFFGYGVSQKATIEILDKDRKYTIYNGSTISLMYLISNEVISPYPEFMVEPTETKRDEKTNTITVVAYDALYAATAHTFSELSIVPPYTMENIANACATALNLQSVVYKGATERYSNFIYTDGANLEGTETLREVLDDIAEATQTIYYINSDGALVFANCWQEPVAVINKSKYFELSNGGEYTLTNISHTTELGENIIVGAGGGSVQVLKDNAFLSLLEDLPQVLEDIYVALDNMPLVSFNCSWRGNPLIEVGDWIAFENKDSSTFISIYVNDTHTYNGGLSATTSWKYTQTTADGANPTTLGEVLKETYAKVDKANKQIQLVVSEVEGNSQEIATIKQTTDEINIKVEAVEEQNRINNEEFSTLKSQVELAVTKDSLAIEIQKELENGVGKVATSTGYTFDDAGLTIEKSGSEIKTQITDDGMTVYKNDNAVLTANNQGVKATDLHAVTYLIIGNNSRFEDYGNRTGCFWIGGGY